MITFFNRSCTTFSLSFSFIEPDWIEFFNAPTPWWPNKKESFVTSRNEFCPVFVACDREKINQPTFFRIFRPWSLFLFPQSQKEEKENFFAYHKIFPASLSEDMLCRYMFFFKTTVFTTPQKSIRWGKNRRPKERDASSLFSFPTVHFEKISPFRPWQNKRHDASEKSA